ncbi:MAG: beta-eliminating lyase-related protein, partial [Mangrovicoccus sp.]
MFFASDNTGPAHPKILEALADANQGYASPYGADPVTEAVVAQLREIFEAPQAAIYLVGTGTAANALILATMAAPWQTIFCAKNAHIHEDECGAPEFFTDGAKVTLVDGIEGKMHPEGLRQIMKAEESRGVHGVQRGPVSLTQATEKGTVYSLDEIASLCEVAHSFGQSVHMDGARFANALVHLGCSPAEMTWKAGVDALSFGGTKNGLFGAEAVIIFDPAKAWEFELRRKRAGHLLSKHRFIAAQLKAYLTDDLWLDMAGAANKTCADLAHDLQLTGSAQLQFQPEANIIFGATFDETVEGTIRVSVVATGIDGVAHAATQPQ